MTINKTLLCEKIEKGIKNFSGKIDFEVDFLLRLIDKIIFHNPTKNCRIKGKKENWSGLPKSKSLFFAGENKGLPIGNLTSQLFGNIYLNNFDHFVKCKLGCRYYGRYVDDIVVVHESKEYLKLIVSVIKNYLKEKLFLELHPNKIYLQYFHNGVRFLGAIIKPFRIYITNRIKGKFFKKIVSWHGFSPHQKILSCVNSYLGMMRCYRTYKLRKKLMVEIFLPKFGRCFNVASDFCLIKEI